MSTYWLRVEGQNLGAFLLDTQDLSTTRGASLTLLDVVQQLPKKLGNPTIEAISTGASIGLYRFDAKDNDEAQDVAERVKALLAGNGASGTNDAFVPARHATFAVLVAPCTTDAKGSVSADAFISDREMLIAAARRMQLNSPTIVYPDVCLPMISLAKTTNGVATRSVCTVDLVRPVRRPKDKDPKYVIGREAYAPVSQAVWDRRGYGLKRKQGFYADRLQELTLTDDAKREAKGIANDASLVAMAKAIENRIAELTKNGSLNEPYCRQIDSISETRRAFANTAAQAASNTIMRGNLEGKIAVIYMDGNQFGKTQDAILRGVSPDDSVTTGEGNDYPTDAIERQRKFDRTIQHFRRELLIHLLHMVVCGEIVAAKGERETVVPGIGAPSDSEKMVRKNQNEDRDGYKLAIEDVIRLETLLWGGDELIFVLPARLGWRAVELIAHLQSTWKIAAGSEGPVVLTNAMSIVFCHDNAPINGIQALARNLADHCKGLDRAVGEIKARQGSKNWGRSETLLFPLVLESFDHVSGDFDHALEQRAIPRLRNAADGSVEKAWRDASFVLTFDQIAAIRAAAQALSGVEGKAIDFSRKKLRTLARSIQSDWGNDPRWNYAALVNAYFGDSKSPDANETKNKLPAAATKYFETFLETDSGKIVESGSTAKNVAASDPFINRKRAWLMLEELWDYLLPEFKEGETE